MFGCHQQIFFDNISVDMYKHSHYRRHLRRIGGVTSLHVIIRQGQNPSVNLIYVIGVVPGKLIYLLRLFYGLGNIKAEFLRLHNLE